MQENLILITYKSPMNLIFEKSTGIVFETYQFGTVGGLLRRIDGGVEILAVVNGNQHNGHFKRFITTIERKNKIIRFLCVSNPILAGVLERRGYKAGQTPDGLAYEMKRA